MNEATRNREALYTFLEIMMEKAYKGRAENKLEYEKGIPKVYVLELFPGLTERDLFDLIKAEVQRVFHKKNPRITIDKNGELLTAHFPNYELYFDPFLFYSSEAARFRFVPVFTTSRSLESDAGIDKLVKHSLYFDYEWLNHNKSFKHLETFRVEAGSEFTGELEDETENVGFEFRSESSEYLSQIIKELSSHIPVNFTKGKFRIARNDLCLYVYSYSNGKMTFYGNDFDAVRTILTQVTDDYSQELKSIEKESELVHPILMLFSRKKWLESERLYSFLSKMIAIEDLKLFCTDILEEESYVKAIVADLHVGGALILRLHRYGLMVTLLKGSCANTVKRLENFIRKSYDPEMELIIAEEEIVEKLEEIRYGGANVF